MPVTLCYVHKCHVISTEFSVAPCLGRWALMLVDRTIGFASLRVLSVASQIATGSAWKILKYLPSTNHVEFVKFTSDFMAPCAVGQEIIDVIVRHCSPKALKSVVLVDEGLRIGVEDPVTGGSHFDEADPDAPLDIMSLEAFMELEVLTVRWNADIRLTPREMRQIPTAWPRIRHLDLCPPHCLNGRVPRLSHTLLLHLLNSCPLLDYLGLRFDATQLTQLDGAPGEPLFPTLRTLRVGDSPISSPSRVLAFIKHRFPKLKTLDTNYDALNGGRGKPTLLDRRWCAVLDGLGLKN